MHLDHVILGFVAWIIVSIMFGATFGTLVNHGKLKTKELYK